jgi:hypothetical protein
VIRVKRAKSVTPEQKEKQVMQEHKVLKANREPKEWLGYKE